MVSLAFLGLNNIGPVEGLALLALGLLLFGKRLPEVGRSLGKGIVEFKRGLKGVADDIEDQANRPTVTKNELPPASVSTTNAKPEEARVARGESVE